MKLNILLLGFTLALFSMGANAGSGHDHGHSHSNAPVNQAIATTTATSIVAEFVKRKKLDESWASIKVGSVEKKEYSGRSEWVISFVNDKITDPAKRTLYVFLTSTGDYIAANYTGK